MRKRIVLIMALFFMLFVTLTAQSYETSKKPFVVSMYGGMQIPEISASDRAFGMGPMVGLSFDDYHWESSGFFFRGDLAWGTGDLCNVGNARTKANAWLMSVGIGHRVAYGTTKFSSWWVMNGGCVQLRSTGTVTGEKVERPFNPFLGGELGLGYQLSRHFCLNLFCKEILGGRIPFKEQSKPYALSMLTFGMGISVIL